jgi:ABC-type antimicrobial peptide transport system permease subunit
VGVADNARLRKWDQSDAPIAYTPLNTTLPDRELIARARNDARNLPPLMRATAQSLNEKVIADAHLLSHDFANRTVESRAMSALVSALALLAISLTCIGMAGIVSHAATLRRKEIGIRIALGANRRTAVSGLVRDVRWPLLAGILFGMFAGVALGGMFAGVPLFVKPFDPPVLLAASLLLTAVVAIAALLPAWRALRLDVVHSLHCE